MNKKGFTLVELLAVIAILAILVIMALPAVLRMFNSAKRDSFTNEVNTIIRTTRQRYLLSGGSETTWTNAEGHTNTLDLTGNSKLIYYVQMDGSGKIIKLQVTNGDYQYNVTNNAGIDVASSIDVEEVTEDNKLVIDGNGNVPATVAACFTYSKDCDSVTYDINLNTCKEYTMNAWDSTEEDAIAYCDKDSDSGYTIEDDLLGGYISISEYDNYGLSNVNSTCSSITITDYDETCGSDVVIPSMIEETPVTIIGEIAFRSKGLTSVIIPNSITSLECGRSLDEPCGAFAGNQLTTVTIPNSVTSIGRGTFAGNQLTTVTIPNSVTAIGRSAFSDNQLTSVIIPNSVTSIGDYAFVNNRLSSITIPNSVTTIGYKAFVNNQLTSATISGNNGTIGQYAFADNQLTSVNILAGVRTIKSYAFQNNQLTSVTISSSVTSIEENAFESNEIDMVTLSYAPGYETIGSRMYQGETRKLYFNTLIIENGITGIDDYAFQNNHLTSVTIPNSITSIGEWAFYNNQLASVTIPNSTITIGVGAFCDNQLSSLTIPVNVTEINDNAFSDNRLTAVTIKGKTSSSGFTRYGTNPWGWATSVTCTKNNTSNVENGCITWGA